MDIATGIMGSLFVLIHLVLLFNLVVNPKLVDQDDVRDRDYTGF